MDKQSGKTYRGSTAFVIAAGKLGYLTEVGGWTEPGTAVVPNEDCPAFEGIMEEQGIPYGSYPYFGTF